MHTEGVISSLEKACTSLYTDLKKILTIYLIGVYKGKQSNLIVKIKKNIPSNLKKTIPKTYGGWEIKQSMQE